MKIISWIKHKLFLHVPLWVCGAIAVVLLEYAVTSLLIPLFFVYFLVRYLWRRRLKKLGKLGKDSGGLFSLAFWGIVAALYFYGLVIPDVPQLVVYETSDPKVFDTTDSQPATNIVNDSGKAEDSSSKCKAKKGFLRSVLSSTLDGINDSAFTCVFIQQNNFIDSCDGSMKAGQRVELDNDAATVELLIAEQNPEICVENGCRVWLIQTTQAQISQFKAVSRENDEAGQPPPPVEGKLVDTWENVVTPMIVFNQVSNGWRHVQITNASGNEVTWRAFSN